MVYNKKLNKIITVLCIITIVVIFMTFLYIRSGVKDNQVIIQINNEKIIFSRIDKKKYKELEMIDSNKMIIKNLSDNDIYIDKHRLKSKDKLELKNIKISKNNKISVNIKFSESFGNNKYYIRTQPKNFPKFNSKGKSKYEGNYYLVYNNMHAKKGYLLKLNNSGKVIFYKREEGYLYNFKKENNKRYSFIKTDHNSKNTYMVILDKNYKEIKHVGFLLNNNKTSIDSHDSIYITDDNYILVTYIKQQVNNFPKELSGSSEMNVENCLIQEIKYGKVIWQFQSIDYPELYKQYSDDGVVRSEIREKYFGNYMHFNSFVIDDKDGNLICSFRNIDEILKINRTTGEIMWTLGGKGDEFGLTEEQKFSKQHAVSLLKDHSILLYDNGAKNEESRVLIINIDEEEKKLKKYNEYPLDVFTVSTGSVQAVNEKNNTFLVCYGLGDYRDKKNVEEIDLTTGKKYFSFEIENNPVIRNVLKIK